MTTLDSLRKNGFVTLDGKNWIPGTMAPKHGQPKAVKHAPVKKRFVRFIAAPIRSEANSRGHWGPKHRRRKEQQAAVTREFETDIAGRGKPKLVVFFLLSSQELDDDNLKSTTKAHRDQIATLCGFNDREGKWRYDQRKPSSYESRGVWIVIQF